MEIHCVPQHRPLATNVGKWDTILEVARVRGNPNQGHKTKGESLHSKGKR